MRLQKFIAKNNSINGLKNGAKFDSSNILNYYKNGQLHGNEIHLSLITDNFIYYEIKSYQYGKRHGKNKIYNNNRITYQAEFYNDKLHGTEIYYNTPYPIQWIHGKRLYEKILDHLNTAIVLLNIWLLIDVAKLCFN